ncbi:alpha/beta hydrolase [Nonomuraea basaltis]|uniref:alpha/beta hydrolase n=1 Tax=Nonomuraea basaltis TaxID=2495887 RepID=UPI00110C6C5E|nr:alpha/beta fold hydrolase [Nonomuraea basaltis]TMR90631.1 alpha/beta hydrolase [Nonomuraea basaltis]
MLLHVAANAHEITFTSLDGLNLRGTLVTPEVSKGTSATVLVHGGGVTRDEGGFFARLALGLADAGLPSLRFDFRAHGESEGRQEDLTLAGVVNDIRAAAQCIRAEIGSRRANIIGASFGGGISALYASRYPDAVRRLVLINPLLNYKRRFVDDKPYWHDDQIDEDAGRELATQGFVAHSPSFKLGRALLNEVFYLQPHTELGNVMAPTLIVHGTGDTFIPVQSSRDAVHKFGGSARLLEIEGAQHGIAVHDDPQYADPQTQGWQAQTIGTVSDWLSKDSVA